MYARFLMRALSLIGDFIVFELNKNTVLLLDIYTKIFIKYIISYYFLLFL